MRTQAIRPFMLAVLFALGGCGGGGGGVESLPPPPVAPPPPPPPPPADYAPVIIFPDVTASTQFATLGYEGKFSTNSEASLIGTGFSVSFDAAANDYVIDVPASAPGVFETTDPNDWSGKLTDPANPGQFQSLGFLAGNFGLKYTAWAAYQGEDMTTGVMAFGMATPSSAVPVTGTASYTADVLGYGGGYIGGLAKLQFDFGASTLGGTLDLWDAEYDPGAVALGHFDFINTLVGSGSQAGHYSGDLLDSTTAQHGSFDGLFTGPNAQELMARWTATYPNSDNVMFGIWLGKKN